MVKIRLKRVGKRKQPAYRVVVADARSPRDGRIIESIGHYQPLHDPSLISIDNERAVYWLQKGAQPSDAVAKILRISGAWTAFSGEEVPEQQAPPPATSAAKATPARSVKATPAASVSETDDDEEAPAEVPEAADQAAAAPEADATDETSE